MISGASELVFLHQTDHFHDYVADNTVLMPGAAIFSGDYRSFFSIQRCLFTELESFYPALLDVFLFKLFTRIINSPV
jgi:hypothetical protein